MNYKITLTTESYLLTASGEGATLIDADVVFHPTGFPMIPARRFKGMLKESMEEVLEIYGMDEASVEERVSCLFGSPGKSTYSGKLIFNNLMYENWPEVLQEVSALTNRDAFRPDFIKSYFTAEVQQTAIGREGSEGEGVAHKRSLRNYRVLKPELTFEALIETTEALDDAQENFLEKAVLNLRYAGTRRNRGFGKIKCSMEKSQIDNISKPDNNNTEKKPIFLEVTLKTLSPVLFSDLLGEQNTVFTQKYVSGNQLRGLFANAYIRKYDIFQEKAHQKEAFMDLFLAGKLKFGALTLNAGKCIPLHIHTDKKAKQKDQSPQSIFNSTKNSTRAIGSIGSMDMKNGVLMIKSFEPKTTFNFHNSRWSRAAGRNQEKDTEGGIFYYESLNEGQIFKGTITGDSDMLEYLLHSFPLPFEARAGRSRSAQYGKVEVSLTPRFENIYSKSLPPGTYILSLHSPLVIYDEWGVSMPTIRELKKVLFKSWGVEVEICKVASEQTYVEQFNAVWQSKSGKIAAYKEGSSFLIKLSESVQLRFDPIGGMTEQGFGRYEVDVYDTNINYSFSEDTTDTTDTNDNNHGQSPTTDSCQTDILKKIDEAYQEEREQLEVKKKALREAGDLHLTKRLNNHLIGRLERLFKFKNYDNKEKIQEWVQETKDKPAGNALKNADLVDKDHKFLFRADINKFEFQRVYWITFFQTLRKMNKQDGKK
jgi:CRISPR-associated protein Csx10